MATQHQDEETSSMLIALLILIFILLITYTVWNEVTVSGPAKERLDDARALCRAHAGAVLNRDLSLENVALIPMGPQWCAVSTLKAPRVEGHIQVALAKP